MQRLLHSVVVALLGMAACGQTGDEAAARAQQEPPTTLPAHRFGPLPPTTVGVLLAAPRAVLAREGRSAPQDAVCFSTDGRSYSFVYLPVDAAGDELEFAVPGDKTERFAHVALATRPLLAQRKITAPYALVEVEVNRGLGSAKADRFVATAIKVLDATDAYPLDVVKAVEQVEKRFAGHLRARGRDIEAELAAAKTQVLAGKERTGPREEEQLTFVTWLPAPERLRVCFFQRITDGAFSYAIGIDRAGSEPPDKGQRFGTMFGVEIRAAYEIDKAGKIVAEAVAPTQRVHVELPPPLGAGR